MPILIFKAGRANAIRSPTVRTRLITGCLITSPDIHFQKPFLLFSFLVIFRPRKGILIELTLSPKILSTAGRRVSEARTAKITTKIAPVARLLNIVKGTINIPSKAKITVTPLNKTARLAVAPELAIASIISTPLFLSSR